MTICPHCKSENNNFYYCKGCGRKITNVSRPVTEKESPSSNFIEEVIDIIERNFISDVTMTTVSNPFRINLGQLSEEEGITLVGSEQWQEIRPKQQCNCFLGEIICIYIISVVITMVGFIAGAEGLETVFQLYAAAFLLLSFLVWFIVPYFTGFSPVSALLYNCSMFSYSNESTKNKASNLLTIFLFSTPYIFVVPFLYSLFKSGFSENYRPYPLSISEIKYLEKMESGN